MLALTEGVLRLSPVCRQRAVKGGRLQRTLLRLGAFTRMIVWACPPSQSAHYYSNGTNTPELGAQRASASMRTCLSSGVAQRIDGWYFMMACALH